MTKLEENLKTLTEKHFVSILESYKKKRLNDVNKSLNKLFRLFNDEKNYHDVHVKVAALNHIYSTVIYNTKPVAKRIVTVIPNNRKQYSEEMYGNLVDKISRVVWRSNGERHSSQYLSFASKYVHFLSLNDYGEQMSIPIYDSYIWKVMVGYLKEKGIKISVTNKPSSYKKFYSHFIEFKKQYPFLSKYSNYEIDKFLWFYGKKLIVTKKLRRNN